MDRVERITNDEPPIAPILVLGVGNILLGDDGVGPRLARELHALYEGVDGVECIDGGTQGLALLGYFHKRRSLVILDALAGGSNPGTVSVFDRSALLESKPARATTAHEQNAGELLSAAELLNELPPRVFLIGVEPERILTELSLSETVTRALPEAFSRACEVVEQELAAAAGVAA